MKRFKKYSFLILLILTCAIAAPFMIHKVFSEKKQPENNLSVTTSLSASGHTSSVESIKQTGASIPASSASADVSTKAPITPASSSVITSSVFTNTDNGFFNDALFIGDSRTVGLSEYGKINGASYFASTGMSVYKILKTEVSIPSVGKMRLEDLLARKAYGKIYIMLGINELGYNFNTTIKKYEELLQTVRQRNPNANIYILSNLHVTKKRSDSDKIFTNTNIDRFNQGLAQLADNHHIFYLNLNELFDDDSGNMRADHSGDGIHLHAKYYIEWGPWLQSHSVQK